MSMNKQELFQAFREAASSEFAHIPRDDSQLPCALSAEFENRMKSLVFKRSNCELLMFQGGLVEIFIN